MITPGSVPDVWTVDFARTKRKKRSQSFGGALEGMFTRAPVPVTVDGQAIAQAICAAMDACEFTDVRGRAWLWNEYCLFLSAADHTRLRDLEATLQTDLLQLLNEEIVRRDARMPDGFLVRLLVDEAEEVPVGTGVLRVRHRKDLAQAQVVPGEITVRADRPKAVPPRPPESTERDSGLRVVSATGGFAIPEGRRIVLGRAGPEAGADHVAIPGASGKINRKHLGVLVRGSTVEVTREAGANPVDVGGNAVAEGVTVAVPLPVELSLSNGAWRGTLTR